MGQSRRGGIVFFAVNGTGYDVKGVATYNIVGRARTTIVGQDGVHGFSEKPSAVKLSIALTDKGTLDLKTLALVEDATLQIQHANGKVVSFSNAWGTGDWSAETAEGEVKAEFEALSAQEIV